MARLTIDQIQAAIEEAGATWEAGETPLTEMSEEELRIIAAGYTPGPDDPTLEESETIAAANLQAWLAAPEAVGYPPQYDLRNVDGRNFVTNIRFQLTCGSCVAFGVLAAAEAQIRLQRGDPNLAVDYSEAHMFYCHAASEGRNCQNGWSPTNALNALRERGVVDEDCFPYTAGDQPCRLCSDWRQRLTTINSWRRLGSTADMKRSIATHGPLVATHTIYEDLLAYTGGIYRHVTGQRVGAHCVCCVGYNDGQRYWICKNSWGRPGLPFGEDGYFRIAYGECGIDDAMDVIDRVVERPSSGIVVYVHDSFSGTSRAITADVPDTRSIGFGDNISSVEVISGSAVLYEHDNYRGRALYVESSVRDTAPCGFKDNISSIRIHPARLSGVTVFEHDSFRGRSSFIDASISDTHAIGLGDNISSIAVHGSASARVYEHKHYRGKSKTIGSSVSDTRSIGMKDNISSIEIL